MIETFQYKGKEDGLSLLVLAAVHGNETAGTKALTRLIEKFDKQQICLKKGKLTLVPVCNPAAYQRHIRETAENLNRVMKLHQNPQTYEQKLANEICPLIAAHRMTLDLHSTHCPDDVPFAFCDYPDEYNKPLITALPIGYVLEGWPQMYAAQNVISDFSTEGYAHTCGNTATTLECGYHEAETAVEVAYQSVLNALAVYDMIDMPILPLYDKKYILMQKFVIKEKPGRLLKNYKHLDKIHTGEELAVYNDGTVLTVPQDGFILLPNPDAAIGTEWYYLGKTSDL